MNSRKSFTLAELLVAICIMALLATVGVGGVAYFNSSKKIENDKLYADQMNAVLQYDGPRVVTSGSQIRAIVASVYQDPEVEGNKYVWDGKNKKILLIDKDFKVYNFKDYNKEVSDWVCLDGSNAHLKADATKSVDSYLKYWSTNNTENED